MTGQSSSQAATPIQWWKPALFFLVVIAGLWYVKWQPYYGKAFTAAETHSIILLSGTLSVNTKFHKPFQLVN